MSNPFVQLFPDLEQACQETLVLTTNERLRRNLLLAFNAAQQQKGLRAWRTPRVQTLEGYLGSLHQQLKATNPNLPSLLGAEAEYQLFQTTAPGGGDRLIPLAQRAWQVCQQWQIPIDSSNFGATENGRTFLDWSQRVSRRLSNSGSITRPELPASEYLRTIEPELTCLAFEQVPSALTDWLDRQAARGTAIRHLCAAVIDQSDAGRLSFDSTTDELAFVAEWVRALLADRALCADQQILRIGIVIPDLALRQTSVARQFSATLDPSLEKGTDGLVDIGGGVPLLDQPVWQAASNWLMLCYDRLPVAAAKRVLADRYLNLPALEQLPTDLPPFVDLKSLAAAAQKPALGNQFDELPEPEARPIGEWLQDFLKILQRAGWNGRQAGSLQYQAYQDTCSRIEALAAAADNRGREPVAVLRIINHYLGTVLFAPERSPAPVQIMGYLETTGLSFSHLWITGMDDQTWPQAPSLNPLVPVSTLRRYGVPRSSPEQETAFAVDRLRHWQTATETLIVSHVRHSGESELRPSPLIRSFPEKSLLDFHPGRPHPFFQHHPGQVELLIDDRGPALPPGEQRGGTGRIRDQAICPFKGFAVHRLGLKEQREPHGLPDALDRGTLIHEALHRLYETARQQGLAAEDLNESAFSQAADQALRRHYGRFPAAFRSRERQRLIALLGVWNQLESGRTDTVIESLEQGMSAEFDGIGLQLRIDRIDRIDDALIVIDYKTGRIGNRMTHDRLVDPQLPLYALTNEAIKGVLYAEIDESRPHLKGIAAGEVEKASLEAPAGGSWDSQRSRWQTQINTLTEEIRSGFAAVAPYEPRACQTCHLKSFCRIDLDVDAAADVSSDP